MFTLMADVPILKKRGDKMTVWMPWEVFNKGMEYTEQQEEFEDMGESLQSDSSFSYRGGGVIYHLYC
ncbi:hypothetical protein ES705_38425 [subsurface metagenome]